MINQNKIYYGLDDVSIMPHPCSSINSRSECYPFYNGKLPIFASPMSAVVDTNNYDIWSENGITPILPRNIDFETRKEFMLQGKWVALSLTEFKDLFITRYKEFPDTKKVRVLIDIANGHMKSILGMIAESKVLMRMEHPDTIFEIMAGNVANPDTYRNLALHQCDYVRCSVGSGACCITASNTGIFMPMATLLDECNALRKEHGFTTKIVADGGINSYNRAITALALGADYVMIGTALAKCYESSSEFIFKGTDVIERGVIDRNEYVFTNDGKLIQTDYEHDTATYIEVDEELKRTIINVLPLQKRIIGMSTKEAQKLFKDDAQLKTSEGITRLVDVEYTVKQWVDNFAAYLRSTMSYCNKRELTDFVGNVDLIINSNAAQLSHNK